MARSYGLGRGLALFLAVALSTSFLVGATGVSAATGPPPAPLALRPSVRIARQAPQQVAAAGFTSPTCGAPLPCGPLTYHGGWIMPTTKTFSIFWKPSNVTSTFMSANYQTLINRYLTDLGSTSSYDSLSQYTDATSGRIRNTSSLGGTIVDTTPTASGATGTTTSPVTDADVQAEVAHVITAKGAGWAASPYSASANFYSVFLPQNVDECAPGACRSTAFCAYHSAFPNPDVNSLAVYATMPYDDSPAFTAGSCNAPLPSPNNDRAADSEISTLSHELSESATNPFTLSSSSGPCTGGCDGWYFNDYSHENGDECNFIYGPRAVDGSNQTLHGHPYLAQQEWSNGDSGCVTSFPDHLAVTSTVTTATPGSSFAFSVTATDSGGHPAPGYTGSVRFTSSDPSAVLPTTYTFLAGDSGVRAFAATLQTVGNRIVTATDVDTGSILGSFSTLVSSPTITTIGSSSSPSFVGQPVAFTATVTATAPGVTPTGSVQFVADGTNVLGSAALNGSGVATVNATSLTIGTHGVSASYTGPTGFNPSTSSPLSQVVTGYTTTTTVMSSANSSVFGQPVTLTATVDSGGHGTPTGTVQFLVDNQASGSPVTLTAISSSAATASTAISLSVGSHLVAATYGGAGNLSASTGNLLGGQTVNLAGTTTTVTSLANPSVFSQPVVLTATVAPVAPGAGTPSGQLQFFVDGAAAGSVTLLGGSAALPAIGNLPVGPHTVTTTYISDRSFSGSAGALAGGQVVNKAATTLAVSSSANPSAVGQPVVFTATATVVAPGAGVPAGQVQFSVDGNPFGGPVAMTGGVATSGSTGLLAVGSHGVSATVLANASFTASPPANLTQAVRLANSTTTLSSSKSSTVFGESVTFTATVAPVAPATGMPTGQVQLFIDGSASGSLAALSAGGATWASISTLATGSHSVTATYGGDTIFNGSTSSSIAQVVQRAGASVVAASGPNPSVFGQPVGLTATVTATSPGTGSPAGFLQFSAGGNPIGAPVPVVGGVATATYAAPAVGDRVITASYLGDTNFLAGAGTTTLHVNAAGTTTNVSSSGSTSTYGHAVTFTATIAAVSPGAGTPTGQVQFFVDGSPGSAAILSGGPAAGATASTTISTLTVGSHTVTATYGADASFTSSASAVTTQTVNQAPVAVTVATAPNPSVFGQPVGFSATVTAVTPYAGTPTGLVQFLVDGIPAGPAVSLTAGVATSTDAALAIGTRTITASYQGDLNFLTGTNSAPQQVNAAASSTTVSSSANASTFGQAVSFTATVAPLAPASGTPGGAVQFFVDGSAFGGPVTLANGQGASGVTSTLRPGPHPVTATYTGDANFAAGTSLALSQVVSRVADTTTVTSTLNPSTFGQPVQFTATVTGTLGVSTGNIQFGVDGVNVGGLVALNAGVATSAAITTMAAGSRTVTATYAGDVTYLPNAASFTQTVTTAGSTTAVGSSSGISTFGQSVQFSATVAAVAPGGGIPTGLVQFTVDGTNYASPVSLSGGSASVSISTLSAGSHQVGAQYPGDGNFTTSGAPLVGQTVLKSGSSTSVSSSANPSAFGQGAVFTATVAPTAPGGGTPDGTVQFSIDGSALGSPVTLSGGSASSAAASTLSVGNHAVAATYSGSTGYTSSNTGLGGGQQVNKAGSSVSVSSSRNPSVSGDNVVFTAAVGPVAPGTGTPGGGVPVQFVIDGTNAGPPATLSGGVATYSTAALATGNHAVVANYAGDADFGSSSGTLPGGQTVASQAPADLSVATFGPVRAVVGLPVTYAVIVTNNGPGAATGVGTIDTLPAGWTVASVASTQGSCTTALPQLSCAIGALASGGYAIVTLSVVAHAAGSATLLASAGADQSDPNPGNNSAGATTRVRRFGYWLFGSDGGVFAFGDAGFFGSTGSRHVNKPVVAMTSTPSGDGYWLFGSDGGVFAFGDAGFFGSTGSMHLNAPIVAMASTPTGHGYWLFGSDGGVFAFGDAGFFGSTGSMHLNAPIVAMAATPSGKGYWLTGADGAIFAFGDAAALGSLAGTHLNSPIVAMAATPSGRGYWLVSSDGGVFAFGDATAFGSLGGTHLNAAIVGVAATADGQGYWLVAADGGVFGFGNAPFLGGMGGQHLNKPINGLTSNG